MTLRNFLKSSRAALTHSGFNFEGCLWCFRALDGFFMDPSYQNPKFLPFLLRGKRCDPSVIYGRSLNYESVWRGRLVRETLFLRFPVYDDKGLVLNVLERL